MRPGRRKSSFAGRNVPPSRTLAQPVTTGRMAGKERDFAAALIGACLMLAGCGRAPPPPSYTSPPASLDARPNPLWGVFYPDMPPEPDGRPFDPTGGLGIQVFADRLAGRRVADFVAHRWDMLRSGVGINDFYPAARAGPGPGLCVARRFQITGGVSPSGVVGTSGGQWLPPVYIVAGSVAPVPQAQSPDYRRRLEQACAQRRDLDMGFRAAAPDQAYLGARLADAVIAAARQQGRLPFALRCTPFLPDMPEQPLCAADVRKSAASIDPRAILEIGSCYERPEPDCVRVELAKAPRRSAAIGDRWTLEISFDRDEDFRIRKVDLADTLIIFD
jgi:hypothetical protein